MGLSIVPTDIDRSRRLKKMTVTESWMTSNITDAAVSIDNLDRDGRGRGVLIDIKEIFKFTLCHSEQQNYIEQLWSYKDLRPINILPALWKVLENLIVFQLRKHVNENNILPLTQSGFRSGHSCTSALTHIVDDIVNATDQNKLTALILLDYSKAFDMLRHSILIAELKFIGLEEPGVTLLIEHPHAEKK
ncbi:hypothetical protein ILUMI_12631 [Ignelater luminosus]|uniref:Reverse transcriptase domain-containing protein n=1 Tax=Ignelater luminosus TaxID=2038154 RepID=A0A8K0CTS2_IGNLU|nr:hypothetical protein ILUMI_12631 [Ignelater luminosus]